MSFTHELKQIARVNGFQLVGTCPAMTPVGVHRLYKWMEQGFAGEMNYFQTRKDAYAHPDQVLSGVRSLLVLGLKYASKPPASLDAGNGKISNYAWGNCDYHDLIHGRLKGIIRWIQAERPQSQSRGVVDTAPLLEREFAQIAGLGWLAKNTMLINRDIGSYFFLAVILTDLELEYDEPFQVDHCGTCTACLEACPTGAFPEPFVLDANKCISYWTIEKRGEIPESVRSQIGDWLFGCDVCQQVCPWNRKPAPTEEEHFQPTDNTNPVNLLKLFDLDEQQFRRRFRKTPLWRSKRQGILRNAAIVLANQRFSQAVNVLSKFVDDEDPVIRETCKWAIGQIRSDSS